MADKLKLEEIVEQMQAWHREATRFRNDGFIQEGYKEKLSILHSEITKIMKLAPINPVDKGHAARFEEGTLDEKFVSWRAFPEKDDE